MAGESFVFCPEQALQELQAIAREPGAKQPVPRHARGVRQRFPELEQGRQRPPRAGGLLCPPGMVATMFMQVAVMQPEGDFAAPAQWRPPTAPIAPADINAQIQNLRFGALR